MKIWIDGCEANVPQRLGSSQVAFGLLSALEKIDKENDYTVLLANKPLPDMPNERVGWKYQYLKSNKFKTWIAIPWALFTAKDKPDLFFSPAHYGPVFSPVKRVITIFDLAFLRFPGYYKPRDLWQLKLWTQISVQKASHIITISKSTASDLSRYYKVEKEKITVAYPGFDDKIFYQCKDQMKIVDIVGRYKIKGDYIIYIGTLQPRKNLIRLIEAFKNIDNLKLVIVGKTTGLGRQGWMYEEILKAPKKYGIEEKVIFTGFASTEDLPYLLAGSRAFILVSLYEGFGIPVVEAMACGTPVIVSNVSSLPEAAGSAGLLINPESVEQITQAIRTIAFDSKLRAKKSKEGLKQAKKFSWPKMAKLVLKVFKESR